MQGAPPLVLVGVTGGVAAYKTCELVRRLVEAGRDVRCALTPDAARFIGPQLLAALTRKPVLDDRPALDGDLPAPRRRARRGRRVHRAVHREHAREAGAGPRRQRRHAERALDAGAAARRAGDERAHVAAPGDAGQRRARCASAASRSSGPAEGALAEGEQGMGRMAEPAEIVAAIEALLGRADGALAGRRVLVTAGGTREPLDGVRFLGNRSLGPHGRRARRRGGARGAEVVTLLANGDGAARSLDLWSRSRLPSELEREALARADWADVVLMAAAVADYRPAQPRGRASARAAAPGRSSSSRPPTCSRRSAARRRPGPGARRLRRRGGRRRRARARPSACARAST